MIKFLHGAWAGFVLIGLIMVIVQHLHGLIRKRIYGLRSDMRLALFVLVVYAIQVILGLTAWFTSDYFAGIVHGQFGAYMKDAHARLIVLEHPFMGILGLLIMLYGFRRMYFQVDGRRKFLSVVITYGLAFLLVLSRIPWSDWL